MMSPDPQFRARFVSHMNRLGLPVAADYFARFSDALDNAGQMAAVVSRLDPGAPVTELVRRTLGLEKLMVAADYDARLYTAGVVTSLALASGQCDGQESRAGQLFRFLFQHQLQFAGLHLLLASNPALSEPQATNAWTVGHRARQAVA